MPDSLYHRLANIEAYLEYIVTNTRPINEIQEYSQISDGKISLIALGVSLFATVFGLLGFIYQKRSSHQLEMANQRKPSLYPIAEKLYNNYIILQIIYEYDSVYNMSYTAEKNLPREKRSSGQMEYINCIKSSDAILGKLHIPESIILLEKYEIYGDDEIYNLAFSIKNEISEYNRCLNVAKDNQKSQNVDNYNVDSNNLFSITRILLRNILLLDSLCCKKKYASRVEKTTVQSELSHFIISRFFSSLSLLTPDNVVADPYRLALVHPIDFTINVSISQLLDKKSKIDAIRKKGNQYNSEKLIFTYINSAVNCIMQIKNRKGKEDSKKKTLLAKFMELYKKKEHIIAFDDKVLGERVEYCLGSIYENIRSQIDSQVFDVNKLAEYDILLQLAIQKHNYLLMGSKSSYDKEMRRVEKKRIWNTEKNKRTNK